MNVHVRLFTNANSATGTAGTAKLSGFKFAVSSALQTTFHSHVPTSMLAANIVIIGTVEADDYFDSLFYPYPFRCTEKSDISSKIDSTLSSCYNTWNIPESIKLTPAHYYAKDIPPPANVKFDVGLLAAGTNNCTSKTTGTAVRLTKFDVAYYCHQNLFHQSIVITSMSPSRMIQAIPTFYSLHNLLVLLSSTTREEHSLLQPLPHSTIPRRVRMFCPLPLFSLRSCVHGSAG